MTKAVTDIMEMANNDNLDSIAIPAIGTGVLKTPTSVFVKCLKAGLKDYVDNNKGSINCKKVEVAIFDKNMYAEVKQLWNKKEEERKVDLDSDSDDQPIGTIINKPRAPANAGRKGPAMMVSDSSDDEDVKQPTKKPSSRKFPPNLSINEV